MSEGEQGPGGIGGTAENPVARLPAVHIHYPETVDITMVDASQLRDYELWFFIAGVLANLATGFVVAWVTVDDADALLKGMTLLFLALFAGAGLMAFRRGKRIRSTARRAT